MKNIRFTVFIIALFSIIQTSAQSFIKAIDISTIQSSEAKDGEGFLTTHWTQNGGYNQFCPMDPVTNQRSYAGCPAVAMAQIVNHLKTTNGTRFTDEDDYEHNYPSRNYIIDDDFVDLDFLSFPEINTYLDVLDSIYAEGGTLTTQEAAALIFACGVACQQVYTSDVSGTFGVQQAYDACLRFGFENCQLFTEPDSTMYAILDDNLANGIPALLALESPDGQTGHNVVVDGHRDDGTYHINFGFGGSLDGWYKIPDPDFPYGMSEIEGIIVNLVPSSLTRVNYIQTPTLKVYPNPARDFITLEGVDEASDIFIFNSLGIEMLHQKTGASRHINIQHLPKGLYLVKVVNAQNGYQTSKLIIE